MQVNVTGFQIKELFEKAKKPLVILGSNADVDLGALSAALVEIFESYNKKAIFLGLSDLPEAAKPLVKDEQKKAHLEPKSLVISLDWVANKLDKVSYDVEGNRFNLIVASRGKEINPTEITYSHRGQEWDLVVMVGVGKADALYSLGIDQEAFLRLPSINIDKSAANEGFAKINIVNSKADSLCAVAALVFREAQIALPTRAAETMLYGMRTNTDNFAKVGDPATFEAAAFCKRSMIPGMVSTPGSEPAKVKDEKDKEPEGWLSPKVFRSSRIS